LKEEYIKVLTEINNYARQKSKEDLLYLCSTFYGFKDIQDKEKELHYEVNQFLQKPSKRKLILLPRGHLKTSIITIGETTRRIVNNPNIRILLCNAVWDNARTYLSSIKKCFESSLFQEIHGNWKGDKWNEDEIVVNKRTKIYKEPTITTAGLEKTVTSQHFDLIIMDDLVARENIITPEQIQKVITYYKDAIPLLNPEGEIWVIGTRWHYDDLYGWILKERKNEFDVFIKKCWDIQGSVIFPNLYSTEKLNKIKEDMGSPFFSAQYLNEPVAEEDAEFKIEWVKYFSMKDIEKEFLFNFITVDPASSLKKHSDYTGIVVVGVNWEGKRYVLETIKKKLNPTERVKLYMSLYKKYYPKRFGIEAGSYGIVDSFYLEEEMKAQNTFFKIYELKHYNISKNDRIRRLIPLFENGKIFILPSMNDLLEEYKRFPKTLHDDLLDTLASIEEIIFLPVQPKSSVKYKEEPYNIYTGY
jgi:phage terminase large subunit-like protein